MSNPLQRTLDKAMDLMGQRQFSDARPLVRDLARKAPKHPLVWNLLGVIAAEDEDHEKAAEYFRKACSLAPNDADFRNNLGEAYRKGEHFEDAIQAFDAALKLEPAHAAAHNNIGAALNALHREEEAADHLAKAIRLRPKNHEAYTNLGIALMNQRKPHKAIPCFEHAMKSNPNDRDLQQHYGGALEIVGRFEDALDLYDKVERSDANDIDIKASRISIFEHQGRTDLAWENLEPLLDSTPEHPALAQQYAKLARGLGRRAEARALVVKVLKQLDLGERSEMALNFALGNLEDGLGNYDAAFAAYKTGNSLNQQPYDGVKDVAELEAAEALYAPEWQKRLARSNNESDVPVFIVGMPRSGTTLCEQILACHPDVHGAGELMALSDLENSVEPGELSAESLDALAADHLQFLHEKGGTATRVIDKLPHNHRRLGFIEQLFPNARIIHCTRSPLDICLSCYFQNFYGGHKYSYDLESLGRHYRLYERAMALWRDVSGLRIFEVSYEAMVADQEKMSREMVEFLDLEWDPALLEFHSSDRRAMTASYDQVRQPIYTRSVSRAEKYAAHLEPLIDALGERA
jgi:tetratricopeptide (TPR) repeat protein